MKACDTKKGMIVEHQGQVFTIRHIATRTPSSRGSNTLYKMKLQNVRSRQNLDFTFKGDDQLGSVDFSRRPCQYSYHDGDNFVLMDSEDYSQYLLSAEDIGDDAMMLREGLEGILVMLIEDQAIGLQLPQSIEMTITETAPPIKGASVTKRTKPATLESGLEVQVPEYISTGERIRISSDSREYLSRATD